MSVPMGSFEAAALDGAWHSCTHGARDLMVVEVGASLAKPATGDPVAPAGSIWQLCFGCLDCFRFLRDDISNGPGNPAEIKELLSIFEQEEYLSVGFAVPF